MIVQPDKASMTIRRLALENYFLNKNLKLNIKELNKRKKNLKELRQLYDLEELLQKPRKIFAWEINYKENDKGFVDLEVQKFLKEKFKYSMDNSIKKYIQLENYIYIKLKYNIIFDVKEFECGIFALRQINPKNIINNENNVIDLTEY